jgi:hypothetical protein
MAPVKPMGIADKHPKTRPGVTGFVQKYNEEAPKPSDLNPDVVTDDSVLPTPRRTTATEARGTRKAAKPRKGKK